MGYTIKDKDGNEANIPSGRYAFICFGNWTTEPPTQEGLYFAYSNEGVEIVHYRGGNEKDVGIMDIEWRYPLSDFSHWLGPLPVPEPPKE